MQWRRSRREGGIEGEGDAWNWNIVYANITVKLGVWADFSIADPTSIPIRIWNTPPKPWRFSNASAP